MIYRLLSIAPDGLSCVTDVDKATILYQFPDDYAESPERIVIPDAFFSYSMKVSPSSFSDVPLSIDGTGIGCMVSAEITAVPICEWLPR